MINVRQNSKIPCIFRVTRGGWIDRPLFSMVPFISVALVGLGWPAGGTAQPVAAGDFLLRNVTLVDQAGENEDVIVNIVVRDGMIDVVTQEEVATDTVEFAYDAGAGILLGQLVLEETPNFLVLSGDPRDDFEVLLDTERYAIFAVHEGRVVRNLLARVRDQSQSARRSGWLAYNPPPIALATSYLDTTRWNRFDTRMVSGLFAAAVVLDRQNWESQDADSLSQVGDLESFDGGEIRGLRFGAVGTFNFDEPWVYTLFGATNAFDKGFDTRTTDDVSLFDWRVDIPVLRAATLSIGKQKEPISLERLTSMIFLPMQERTSVSDALLPSRNVGAVLSGTALGEKLTWAGGAFNDWLDDDGSISDNATQAVGRVSWNPWSSEDESNLVHLAAGVRYSNTKEGFALQSEPEFNQAPNFIDGGNVFEADRSFAYNLEASWRKGPLWLHAELVDARVASSALGDPRFRGYHVTGSWSLTGEMREYNRRSGIFNRVPIARSVDDGGPGSWEAAVRLSNLDASDGFVDAGDMEILSLGLNWWLSPVFAINFNYRWIDLDRGGLIGDSSGFMSRVVLVLE